MRSLFILALLVSGSVFAQQMPTDTDLKSIYCLKIKQRQSEGLSNTLKGGPSPTQNPAAYQFLESLIREYNNDINRLQSYLLPKLKALDTAALIAAANRADADLQMHSSTSGQCNTRCETPENGNLTEKWAACMNSCGAEFPATVRIDSCKIVNWLPF